MKYSVSKRVVRLGKDAGKELYYANPVSVKTATMKDLCDLMAKNTTVGRADIYAVLEQLSDSIRYLVGLGMNVDLAGLATFRGTFKSQGVENKEDFNPRMHISKPAIGCILKRSFKELNGLTYEQVEVANKTNSNTPTPSQPSNTGDNSGGGEQGSTGGGL